MKTLFCALISLALCFASRAADSDAARKDLAQLEGKWSMLTGIADGQDMPQELAKNMKRTFKGNELVVTMGDQTFFKARVSIDPSKTPKTIDYDMLEGSTKGKKQLGVYELKDGVFKSSFAKPDAPRPTDFKPGVGVTVSTWKRDSK